MALLSFLGKAAGGAQVSSKKELEATQAYQNKDMKALGGGSAEKVLSYMKTNPFNDGVESASRAEGKQQIENQRLDAEEDLTEKGTKVGYNSGLMDKLQKGVRRTYDDAGIEESRRSKLDFLGRKVGFDMDLLDKSNQMAQFGSDQSRGSLELRNQQKQAQSEAGWKTLSRMSNMAGSAMSGGMLPVGGG